MLASAGRQQEVLTPLEDLGRDLTATYGESTREVADLLFRSPGFAPTGGPRLSCPPTRTPSARQSPPRSGAPASPSRMTRTLTWRQREWGLIRNACGIGGGHAVVFG
jgi:hypothetical protein